MSSRFRETLPHSIRWGVIKKHSASTLGFYKYALLTQACATARAHTHTQEHKYKCTHHTHTKIYHVAVHISLEGDFNEIKDTHGFSHLFLPELIFMGLKNRRCGTAAVAIFRAQWWGMCVSFTDFFNLFKKDFNILASMYFLVLFELNERLEEEGMSWCCQVSLTSCFLIYKLWRRLLVNELSKTEPRRLR